MHPPIVFGDDQPLVVIGDGSCLVVNSSDYEVIDLFILISDEVVLEDIEGLVVVDYEQPLAIGCHVNRIHGASTAAWESGIGEVSAMVLIHIDGIISPSPEDELPIGRDVQSQY